MIDLLGFNDTSVLVGHFVSSPREREKRDRRGDEREEQGRKKNELKWRNRRNKNIPSLPLPAAKNSRPCPTVKPISVGCHVQWHQINDNLATQVTWEYLFYV